MPPLILEGFTLGDKHQNFNEKVNETIKNEIPFETILSQCGDTDIDYLFKIDIACYYRNVDYIIDTLKSEDPLHVARAIKKSPWLITDDQYAHIINPQHLNTELFPQMTTKAANKLLLDIRLNLKNEQRGDEFYNYYVKLNFTKALKWLPKCSLPLVKNVLSKHFISVKPKLFKKLCEKFPEVFDICINNAKNYYVQPLLESVMFFLNEDVNKYLDFLETLENWCWPKFNKRHTALIMKLCPERILNKFEKYYQSINIQTVAKYIKPNEIVNFLISISKKKELIAWLTYDNIKPFINHLPKDRKFDYIQQVFIEKTQVEDDNYNDINCIKNVSDELLLGYTIKSANIFNWYNHAPFDKAFIDLKIYIENESSPEQRANIFKIMLKTADRDMDNILQVLQYYHDKYINETIKYKISVINYVLTVSNTHEYDEKSWKILDDLFHSAEVYNETKNNVQHCVESIIVYNVIHKQEIPEIIKQKFQFNALKRFHNKLNEQQNNEVFYYLLNYIESKIKNQHSNDEDGINKLEIFLENIIDLLSTWNKDVCNYPLVKEKIKDLIIIKYNKKTYLNLDKIFNKKKSWKILFFEQSLFLSPCEKIYLNVLKHNPNLLQTYFDVTKLARYDVDITLETFLCKIRIYWQQTLAKDWENAFIKLLNDSNNDKILIHNICVLLSRNDIMKLLVQYAPKDSKINWKENNELLFSLRKNFAKSMYKARPQLPPNIVLSYAHGDYLQHVLPSLNAVFNNLPSERVKMILPELLNGSASLQKHGIRVAFSKLDFEELINVINGVWKSSKNLSIRSIIFRLTYDSLCLEKTESKIDELWALLDMFIDDLSHDEDLKIYKLLGMFNQIPQKVVGKYFMKSYKVLKGLPARTNCHKIIEKAIINMRFIIDSLDDNFIDDFMSEFVINGHFKTKIIPNLYKKPNDFKDILINYVLCVSTEAKQEERYNKIIKPWLLQVFALWDVVINSEKVVEQYFIDWLFRLRDSVFDYLLDKKYVNPCKVLIDLQKEIEIHISDDSKYRIITMCKLIEAFAVCYENIKFELEDSQGDDETGDECNRRYQDMWQKIAPSYAVEVLKIVEEDCAKYFHSIWMIFSDCLLEIYKTPVFENAGFPLEQALLAHKSCVLAYLVALYILPETSYNNEKGFEEIKKNIVNNASLEVRMHYYEKYM